MLWLSPGRGASPERVSTRFELQLAQTQSSVGIKEAVALLTPHLTSLEAKLKALDPSARVTLTGGAVSRQAELDAISQSMLTALPVALALCLLIVGLALRSVYQSLCCVLTLVVVVALLFAGMSVFGYALNFMSATLGALSIGVGVDYATHITVRITEERDGAHLSERALQRAIAGTGLALLVSAGSSVLGFCVLGMAPMPLFAAYGRFTALMITLALVSSITLLPALLLLPDRLRKRHLHHA
jgi:predicted RND superfamily exporter protein